MRGGCNCALAGLGAGVTVSSFPCQAAWARAQQNPTLYNRTLYQLCLLEHKAGIAITSSGHWIWAEIRSLWNKFWSATTTVSAAAANAVKAAVVGTGQTVKQVLKKAMELIQWLDDQAAHVLTGLEHGAQMVMMGLALFLAIELAPAVVAIVETATGEIKHRRERK